MQNVQYDKYKMQFPVLYDKKYALIDSELYIRKDFPLVISSPFFMKPAALQKTLPRIRY